MGPFIFDPTVGSTACPAALTAPIYLVRKQTHRYDTDASSASCNSCVGNTSIGFRKPVRLLGKRILPELRTEPISQQRQRHFEFHQQGVCSVLAKSRSSSLAPSILCVFGTAAVVSRPQYGSWKWQRSGAHFRRGLECICMCRRSRPTATGASCFFVPPTMETTTDEAVSFRSDDGG
jgi:hypothetical protein